MYVGGEAPPLKFRNFCVLKHTAVWDEAEAEAGGNGGGSSNAPSKHFSYRLLLAGAAFAYVYNRDSIMCISGAYII